MIRARVAKPGTDANDTQATGNAVRQALDAVLGAGSYTVLRTEAVGPKVGGELRHKGLPGHPAFVLRRARLPRLPVRVALRARRGHRHRARHPRHDRLHRHHAAGGEPHGRGGGAVDGRLLAQRHDHHLRPRPGEPAQAQEGSVRGHPQPLDQRDAAPERADARHHAVVAPGAHDLRRRGDQALRPGDVLRRLHRHVLVDLHRLAGAHGHRAPLARAGGAWAPARPRRRRPVPGSRKAAEVG